MYKQPYLVYEFADCARSWVFEFIKVFSEKILVSLLTTNDNVRQTHFIAVIMGGGPAEL